MSLDNFRKYVPIRLLSKKLFNILGFLAKNTDYNFRHFICITALYWGTTTLCCLKARKISTSRGLFLQHITAVVRCCFNVCSTDASSAREKLKIERQPWTRAVPSFSFTLFFFLSAFRAPSWKETNLILIAIHSLLWLIWQNQKLSYFQCSFSCLPPFAAHHRLFLYFLGW